MCNSSKASSVRQAEFYPTKLAFWYIKRIKKKYKGFKRNDKRKYNKIETKTEKNNSLIYGTKYSKDEVLYGKRCLEAIEVFYDPKDKIFHRNEKEGRVKSCFLQNTKKGFYVKDKDVIS